MKFKYIFIMGLFVMPSLAKANHLQVDDKMDQGQQSTSKAQADTAVKTATGNQTVTVNVPAQSTKVIVLKKTVYRKKAVKVYVYNPNRLQLLLGETKTKLKVQEDCCSLNATRQYETDVGLQYLRDFGSFTGSFMGTVNRSYYVGLGFNW